MAADVIELTGFRAPGTEATAPLAADWAGLKVPVTGANAPVAAEVSELSGAVTADSTGASDP